MEENRIVIDASAKEARPLPMGGKDSRGNFIIPDMSRRTGRRSF